MRVSWVALAEMASVLLLEMRTTRPSGSTSGVRISSADSMLT